MKNEKLSEVVETVCGMARYGIQKRYPSGGAPSFLSRGKFNKFSHEFLCKMPIDKNPIMG